ncbi:carbohydrate ABC transporter permease [Meiothermus sp.]|uniref:carbohydrate ABC transporter permease n=1 Tax=Meiothermus sp. TaxID=1955249 RepID=UPI00260A251A|nr:carbohydrate ABC transporter permease [Meiothermus sp.]
MAFPFYWMLATSLKSPQEAQQSQPIWVPERLKPANWGVAARLGAQGGSALWGGFGVGQTVTLRIFTGEVGPPPQVSIPVAVGAFSDPRAEGTLIRTRYAEGYWEVSFTNRSSESFRLLPVVVRISKSYPRYQPELPPDAVRSSGEDWRLEWVNVAPGSLGYVFHNYREAWHAAPFGRYFFNSFFTAGTQVLVGLLLAAMAAFALARIEFPGKGLVWLLILATLMIPGEVLLIPNYILLSKLGWLNTYYALIVPWLASVFGIFLLRQFYLSLPSDLFDAARIDGASYWIQLVRIALPLSVPGLVTYGIFTFLGAYNALIWPLIVTDRPEIYTIQRGLQVFIGEAGSDYGALMAASTLSILPIVLGYFFAQRQFIQGVARSGIK